MRRPSRRDPSRPDKPLRRRSGPADEDVWWQVADQAYIEQPMLNGRDLPKGWRPTLMVNNDELLDPYDGVAAAASIRQARASRVLSALDEGVAYRARNGQLLVLRAEAFLEADESGHRDAWRSDGRAVLTATYQARWAERDIAPNWIETTTRGPGELPADVDPRIDWLRVEDHTDPKRSGRVQIYEHLTLWCGRAHAVVTVRHQPDLHLEDMVHDAATVLLDRLDGLPPHGGGPDPGS